jgi:hypothetical protein
MGGRGSLIVCAEIKPELHNQWVGQKSWGHTSSSSQSRTYVLHHRSSNNGLNSLSINLESPRISSLCRVPSLSTSEMQVHQSAHSTLARLNMLAHQIALPSHHMLQSPPRSNSSTQIRQVDQVLQLYVQANLLPLRIQQVQSLQLGPDRSTGIESMLMDEHEEV